MDISPERFRKIASEIRELKAQSVQILPTPEDTEAIIYALEFTADRLTETFDKMGKKLRRKLESIKT